MTKTEAIKLFGSPRDLGAALGITRHAIYQWPEELDQDRIDRVTGAAIRLGKADSLPDGSGLAGQEAVA